ncbi:hypothetical protein CERSUDRAFT_161607 [Gelatoporia subvermispora B]|uniref:tRNA (guanine(37)-N1)-methyltransferase n=1 Tax=Ceriporiopsis subvermispora (strain B) TaxID=914234 RepID=M2R184_CERS8|nr:hypothetical protein CERSUDRAFT_161607 [Gelatoporia subvermispora B]
MRSYSAEYLDLTPPVHRGLKEIVDKSIFRKDLNIIAAKIDARKTQTIARALRDKAILHIRSYRNVEPAGDGKTLVLLKFPDEALLPPDVREFLEKEGAEFVPYTMELDYDHWTADDILQSVLPEDLAEQHPSGFAMVGHIAHLNLPEEYLPYKHIIGQVILEKNSAVRTVVNKLQTIDDADHVFRVFKMELLAGVPDYVVSHMEQGCKFTFDFTEVYWNSRLQTEHTRIVDMLKPTDLVADPFAGVGPFAIPAAKKGCAVFANDLNPSSYHYLNKNTISNKVKDLIVSSNEDGRKFIRYVFRQAWDMPMPPHRPKEKGESRRAAKRPPAPALARWAPEHARKRITHFVMNLPQSAIEFLDAFRGVLAPANMGDRPLSGEYSDSGSMPMIHCYCFTRFLEPAEAEADIRQRVEAGMGHPLGEEVSLYNVRSVAPNKDMYCISFRLPYEVAFAAA